MRFHFAVFIHVDKTESKAGACAFDERIARFQQAQLEAEQIFKALVGKTGRKTSFGNTPEVFVECQRQFKRFSFIMRQRNFERGQALTRRQNQADFAADTLIVFDRDFRFQYKTETAAAIPP